jgi:decaprenyl-phosphate phosphoribosyltransferase
MRSALPTTGSNTSLVVGLILLVRPRQWTKNLLVFAGPAAAGVLHNWYGFWRTIIAFVAFCAAAGGGYVVNDLLDVEADRAHPKKAKRPIASGAVPEMTARALAGVLFLGALGIAGTTGHVGLVVAVIVYEVLVVLYSFVLKHIAVVDLIVVASGFVIRAIGGAAAVGVYVSNWFLIVTSLVSLLVVTGKRYGELQALGDRAGEIRSTLTSYTPEYLRTLLSATLGGVIISYCLYAFERGEEAAHPILFELSIVPVVTALLRFALLLDRGEGEAPDEVFLADRPLQVLGMSWAFLLALGVYL